MSSSYVMVGQRIAMNLTKENQEMYEIQSRIDKMTGGKLTFHGGTSFFGGSDYSDGIVGVVVNSAYVSYEDAEYSEISPKKIETARKTFETAIAEAKAFYVRLEKSFPGFEPTDDIGVWLVHEMEEQSAAEVYHGIEGTLSYDSKYEWKVELNGKHDFDLDALHEELKGEMYQPPQPGDEEYDEDMVDDDIINCKGNVVELLKKKIGAQILNIYNEHTRSYDMLCGKSHACLLEGATEEKLTVFDNPPALPKGLQEARFYLFMETYG